MFKKNNRYVTKGVNEKIDIRVQLIMWGLIDDLKERPDLKLDYLQVFKLINKAALLSIRHSQEVPKYDNTYFINIPSLTSDFEFKIYVIDSESYSTMLLAEEY